MNTEIKYPRRRLLRHLLRVIVRILVFFLARAKIKGRENFPQKGPVILVGNHTAALEVVLMAIYPPKQVEFMGSVDIPHEGLMNIFIKLYGLIPVFRGNVTPSSMKMGVNVLKQEGMLGIFPEGGIWEPSIRRAQSGVAWLSYHAQAPVLPIGFGSMAGLLGEVFAFKRPVLKMNIGQLIPAVQKASGKSRKQHFQDESDRIMDAVWALIPEEDRQQEETIRNESFELLVETQDEHGKLVPIPAELHPKYGAAFSKFTHRTTLIKNFILNLEIFEVNHLMNLIDEPPLDGIITATMKILAHLDNENPYYFTYRYGLHEGKAMEKGIREVQQLALWAQEHDLEIKFTPLWRFTYLPTNEALVIDRTQPVNKW